MDIQYDNDFSFFAEDSRSSVFQIFPSVFDDERGFFCELMKDGLPFTFQDFSWIKQINVSKSSGGIVRGCHAQKAPFCQGKMVRAVNEKLYDAITDARPNSETFGKTKIYELNPKKQNMLWVPRGFLHAFIVPPGKRKAYFEYFCDAKYDKNSEIGVNPNSILPFAVKKSEYLDLKSLFSSQNGFQTNSKDSGFQDFAEWAETAKREWETSGNLWYANENFFV